MKKLFKIFICALLSTQLMAREERPWLTGPLIAPHGDVVPYGDFLLRSIFFGGDKKLFPSSPLKENVHGVTYRANYYFGLTSFCDFNLIADLIYNTTSGKHDGNIGDLTLGFDFQLLRSDYTPYFPGIKFAIREIFPTGKYQLLRPKKQGADQTGEGAFSTQFDLIFYKVFPLSNSRWLSLTLSAACTLPLPLEVHDFNAYGGGFGTKGTVTPGPVFQAIASFEFTLNRNWALALDNVYRHVQETSFFGWDGIALDGTLAPTGRPDGHQMSFCPSIEWNLDAHFGIIAGYYFSAFSKNCDEFRYAAINFNYLY